MKTIPPAESRLHRAFRHTASRWTAVGVESLADYHARELDHQAASASFYAVFSIFPLMTFLVFVVGALTGSAAPDETASVVLGILKQLTPTMSPAIEQGVLEILRMNAVSTWLNAALLAWSGLQFFSALQTALSSVPRSQEAQARLRRRRALARSGLSLLTLGLGTILAVTLVLCDSLARSPKIPPWLFGLPYAYQDVIFWAGRSGILLSVVSIGTVAALYKIVLPCRLRWRAALSGASVCTVLLVLSRSAYWIYLHYQGSTIQANYGAFSGLMINMLWIHFVINCVLYSALFAIQLDGAEAEPAVERPGDAGGPGLSLAA